MRVTRHGGGIAVRRQRLLNALYDPTTSITWRVEGGTGLSPNWLTLGLCYTALASGHVRAALAPQRPADEVFPLLTPAMLTVGEKTGGAEVRFSDATARTKAMDWELMSDSQGRAARVKHVTSTEVKSKARCVRGH